MRLLFFIIGMFAVTCLFGQKEYPLLRQGNKAYGTGKYEEAEKDYRKALEINKESFPGQFNLGTAVYQKQNYKEAENIYGNLAGRKMDPKTKAQVFHNLGNSLLQDKQYDKSIVAYKNALLNYPSDLDTKYNLEYAKMMLKKQQQQQQQQDQKKDQKDKQDQQQNKDQNQQKQPPDQKKISKEDAERMLEAMKNEEKKTMEKVNKEKARAVRVAVEKDW